MSEWEFFREQIKERVRLSSIVGRKVRFDARKSQPARGEFWACCPFHSEKSPSFHVLDGDGFYHCFGCHESGDVVRFIMATENRSFREAMEMLAEEAGIDLPKPSPRAQAEAQQRASMHEILENAAKFYEASLKRTEGDVARDYLRGRGLAPEVWATFRLGYAPGGGHALIDHLKAQGIEHTQMRAAGLLAKKEQPADQMRNRLMFPIMDGRGRVIAFGGRALEVNAQVKYLNSPETELFNKGRTLYNFSAARKRSAASGTPGQPHAARLVVAEGYMDVIALSRDTTNNCA